MLYIAKGKIGVCLREPAKSTEKVSSPLKNFRNQKKGNPVTISKLGGIENSYRV
jgi:hypothetical protein